ncbi:MAG: HNH endonuclease [Akkermansiaceae bacterium]|nr:HNH endonuclease [Akkermansiaceae bacterium]
MAEAGKRRGFEFSEATKAEIFARDRATCAFSGKSLWILDYGISPLYDVDWADHRKPRASGGTSTVSNGICASSFHNSKKSSNGRDNCYLFDEGEPTDYHFWNVGTVSQDQLRQLKRLSRIQASDWYFNRAIYQLFKAAGGDRSHQRGVAYYKKAARTFLGKFIQLNQKADLPDFTERKLVLHPAQSDVKLLLQLQGGEAPKLFDSIIRIYRFNLRTMERFWDCEEADAMREVIEQAADHRDFSPLVAKALRSQLEFWKDQPADPAP